MEAIKTTKTTAGRRFMETYDLLEKERNYLVVKSNDLIEGLTYKEGYGTNGPPTAQQWKIIDYLISHITPKDSVIPQMTFDMRRFAQVIGVDRNVGGSYYIQLKKSVDKLGSKTIWLKEHGSRKEMMLHWIQDAEFDPDNGTFTVSMDPRLKNYLCGLNGNYTAYSFKTTSRFECKFSTPIYNTLKAAISKNRSRELSFLYEIEDFKASLDVRSYNITNLCLKVLDKACEEINKYTELKVVYSLNKEGRKTRYICFDVQDLSRSDEEDDLTEFHRRADTLQSEFEQLELPIA